MYSFKLGFGRSATSLYAILLLGAGTQATAQDIDAVPTAAKSFGGQYANAVRIDIGGFIASNIAYQAFNDGPLLAPVMVSYERQAGARVGLVLEGLVNGGSGRERKKGVSVQGRYYWLLPDTPAALAGFYVAPVLAYRSVTMSWYSNLQPVLQRSYLAGGALIGWQGGFRPGSRWLLDISAGLMSWQQVGKDKNKAGAYPGSSSDMESYYNTHPTDFDGRLGVGFRF